MGLWDSIYYQDNRDRILARKRIEYQANRAHRIERQRAYRREHQSAIRLSDRLGIPVKRARTMLERGA